MLSASEGVLIEKSCLPECAGRLDTASLLPPMQHAAIFGREQRVIDTVPSQAPQPCFRVSPQQEMAVRRHLLQTGMCIVLEEGAVATRDNGRILLSGLSGVKHPQGQRLIFDCRPVRLPWVRLPAGLIRLVPAARG